MIRSALIAAGKAAGSAAILACLVGLALDFHISSYAYLAAALAGSFVIHVWTRPGARSVGAAAGFGVAIAAIYMAATGERVLWSMPAFLGLGSLASLSLAAVWGGRERRASRIDTCMTAAMFPMFLIVAGFSLATTTALHPKTYDLFLYAFDARLGFQPSFVVGRWFARSNVLWQVCYFGYEALPLSMAISFAMERARHGQRRASLMMAFMLAAVGGFLLYNVCPAAGPIHVFGKQFPYAAPTARGAPLQLVAIGDAPRNGMPSVHIAMALLIFWHSRGGAKLWRAVAGTLVGLTALATLGLGEHYLIDLVVAVPFAVAVEALASSGLAWRETVRWSAAVGGLGMVAAWLAYLRMPAPPSAEPVVMWTLLLATALNALVLQWQLDRSTPATIPKLSPLILATWPRPPREARGSPAPARDLIEPQP